MKKLASILLVCSITGTVFAQNSKKVSPVVDNPSIRKSKAAMNHQGKEFDKAKYGSVVKGHGAGSKKPQTAKPGKGL